MQPIIAVLGTQTWTLLALGLIVVALGLFHMPKWLHNNRAGHEHYEEDMLEFTKPEGCATAYERFEATFAIYCNNAFIDDIFAYHAAAVRSLRAALRTTECARAKLTHDMKGRMTVESRRTSEKMRLEIDIMRANLHKLEERFQRNPLLRTTAPATA